MPHPKHKDSLGRISFWGGRHATTEEIARDAAARETLRDLRLLADAMTGDDCGDDEARVRVVRRAREESAD